MRRAGPALLGLALLASVGGAGWAEEMRTSLRPRPRPAELTNAVVADPVQAGTNLDLAALARMRPQPRPEASEPAAQPATRAQPAAKAQPTNKAPNASMKGAVCKRAEIKGTALKPINGRLKGCSIKAPVQVSQISGVAFNPPVTIDCEEAVALSDWITNGLQPAFKGTIVALQVADSYSCRPRNNVRGNPVSVHGLGQAVDISAFVTNSGRSYSVAGNYNAQIRAAQKAGCGTFSTILGPGSDGYHEDHIHFDVSQHGGRDYCR